MLCLSYLTLSPSSTLRLTQVISLLETDVLEPEQSPTSCISSRNQATYEDSALPHAPCQIVVPAQSVCTSSLISHFVLSCS